jgi:uncharacterized protein (TIGR02453 family)
MTTKPSKMYLPDDDIFPPFSGFPREGLNFMRRLKKNNTRIWFENHKNEYETHVKLPMQSLITSLQPEFEKFAPEFDINPKRSIFRIYRDIRFSKDKTPYKTHAAAHFVLRGKPKGLEGSGYYLHIEPGEVFLGGGIYIPDNDQLKKIRAALDSKPEAFLHIINKTRFKKMFGVLEGEKLQRVPQGYSPDHPMAEWLKLKQFFVGVEYKDSVCTDEKFIRLVASVYATATPLVRFLNEALSK